MTVDHRFVPGLCKSCNYLRSKFYYETEAKKELGNHLHHLAASWARGEDIETDPLTDRYIDGLEQWYKDYEPRFIDIERTVYFKAGLHLLGEREFVGTFDLLIEHNCTCPLNEDLRCTGLYDIKTGTFRGDKEWLLQLSAYRYAHYRTSWVEGKQTLINKMPTVNHTGVLWLHDDGTAEMVNVETTNESFNNFLRLLDLWAWDKKITARLAELEEEEAEAEAYGRFLREVEGADDAEIGDDSGAGESPGGSPGGDEASDKGQHGPGVGEVQLPVRGPGVDSDDGRPGTE